MRDKNIGLTEEKIILVFEVIKRYDTYIVSTNAKASLIIAFNSVILGTTLLKFGNIIAFYTYAWVEGFVGLILALVTGSCILSLTFIFSVVYPYFGRKTDEEKQQNSLVYFGSVRHMSGEDYLERLRKSSQEELAADLSHQVTILADGLQEKMIKIRRSISAIIFSLILIFLLVLLRVAQSLI
jgi:hypothetical protein